MQKGCTLNKIQIVLKSFVPVLFYNLSLVNIIVGLCMYKYVAIFQRIAVNPALSVTKGINFKSGKLNEQSLRKSVY